MLASFFYLSPEKRTTEDELVGWQYWCSGRELGQTPGDGGGQGGLTCCSPRGHEESDETWWLKKSPRPQALRCVVLSDVLLCFFRPEWVGSSLSFESGTHFFSHRASNESLPFLVRTFHTLTRSSAFFVLWHIYFFVVCRWTYFVYVCRWTYFLQMQPLFYSPIWPGFLTLGYAFPSVTI